MRRTRQDLWSLVWLLAKTDFKLRYQGSVLGFLWALLKPLAVFAVLNLVFSHFFAHEVPTYSLQLLTGIFLWSFFAEGTMSGLTSLMGKAHILTKIAFPRWVVVVAASLQALMTFAINVVILLAALLISGVSLELWQLFAFAGYLLLLSGLVLGFSFLAAPLFLRFRDMNQIWEVVLMVGFYAAPIIYPLKALPEWLRFWLYLNPMTFLIEHTRAVLFMADLSQIQHHLIYAGLVTSLLFLSWFYFLKFEKKYIELL